MPDPPERDGGGQRGADWFESLVAYATVGIAVTDAEGTVTYMCPNIVGLTGHAPEHYLGRAIAEDLHPADDPGALHADALELPGQAVESELRLRHRDGAWRWHSVSARNLLEDSAVGGVVYNLTDIHELHRALDELHRASEERERHLRALQRLAAQQAAAADLGQDAIDGAPQPHLVHRALELTMELLEVDLAAHHLVDTTAGALSPTVTIPPGLHPGSGVDLEGTVATEALASASGFATKALPPGSANAGAPPPGTWTQHGLAVVVPRRDHGPDVIEIWRRDRPFANSEVSFVRSIANLVGAGLTREAVDAAVARAEEGQRRVLSEAIHDDPLQVVVAAKMRVGTIMGRADVDGSVRADLASVEDDLAGAVDRLRSLMFELYPANLEDEGLASALRIVLDQASRMGGFVPECRDTMEFEPSLQTRFVAFRTAQEAIVNATKHSSGSTVSVELATRDSGLQLTIVDDGVGFDPDAPHDEVPHLGVRSMRDRIARMGGWFRTTSARGEGTSVAFWIPDPVGAASAAESTRGTAQDPWRQER